MSRFLILSWDGGGNTPSAFNLGTHLVRRGHQVRMLGWDTMAGRAAAAGLEFGTYSSLAPWPADLPLDADWDRLMDALWGPGPQADIVAEAAAFEADVLVIDCMMKAGYAAATQLRLPSVSLVHVLYSPFVDGWGAEMMETDVAAMLASSDCVLALQPPGFDAPGEPSATTAYVGAVLPPDDAAPLDARTAAVLVEPGDPWVLLSLSTTLQGQLDALPGLLSALAPLPIRVLLTLGGAVAPDEVAVPANVTVRGFVPHESVLPHVAAIVTHAGMSTIAMALAAGVPMVCVPQGRDQPVNAARVHEVGAGLMVARDAAPEVLAAAVSRVLADVRFAATAQRIAAQAAAIGHGALAADLVEALVRVPALPSSG